MLPDKDPYHNRGRDQMRKKGGPEFECLWLLIQLNLFNPTHDGTREMGRIVQNVIILRFYLS
jgi:hypothetical protein